MGTAVISNCTGAKWIEQRKGGTSVISNTSVRWTGLQDRLDEGVNVGTAVISKQAMLTSCRSYIYRCCVHGMGFHSSMCCCLQPPGGVDTAVL